MKEPRDLAIDWVAPPFAGHLYPMLLIARGLRARGFERQRVLSTPTAARATRAAGLPFVPILEGADAAIMEVANGRAHVGRGPRGLVRQFRETLRFLETAQEETRALWRTSAPDIAIVDSVLPTVGVSARGCGSRWWTSMASLSPTETRTGTPSYLGGWRPGGTPLHALRDRAGRTATRTFKRVVGRLFRGDLERVGFPAVYRQDGTEAVYSDDVILGLGHEAFEFARDWPPAMRFVGCPVGSPIASVAPTPEYVQGKRHLFVTLGTHLHWAKDDAFLRALAVGERLDDWEIHFSRGNPRGDVHERRGNVVDVAYVPYGEQLARYDVILHHGGAGITYAALAQGVPSLVWPRDFDQFDNAARVVALGAGLRTRGSVRRMVRDVRRLAGDGSFRAAADALSHRFNARSPVDEVSALLRHAVR